MTAQAPHGMAAMARSFRIESEIAHHGIKLSAAALVAARLELLREFAHEQYSVIERQAIIAQWSLEDGDDAGAGYALTRLAAHAAAAAETALDVAAIKKEAAKS
jgi:hypothetical protein